MRRKEAEIEVKDFQGRNFGIKDFEFSDSLTNALAHVIAKYGVLDEVELRVEEIRDERREGSE